MTVTAMPVPDDEVMTAEDLLGLVERLRHELQDEFVDRDTEIHLIIVGLLSELHVLLYGLPGIAKSKVVDRLFLRISGAKYGKFPMHRLMSADDLFGPVDVAAYAEEGRFRRILDSYLADCEYVNLEEIFKAGPATLGLLLPALNERTIRNDGRICPIPLRTMLCSSNELPKDELTQPLYDRIPLRRHVQAPSDPAEMQRLLELPVIMADCEAILTGDQLHQIQDQVRLIPFHPSVAEKLTELYFKLVEKNIVPSPRRLDWMRRAMQAEAWLDGNDIVTSDYLSICRHGLWDLPGQIGDVEDAVMDLANPLERRTLKLLEDVSGIRKMLPDAKACKDEEEQQALGMEIYDKVKLAGEEIKELEAEAGSGRRQQDLIRSGKQAIHEVLLDMLRNIMHIPEDEIEAFSGTEG